MAKGKYRRKRMCRQRQQTRICDSGLSMRVTRCLERAGITTLRDLDMYSMKELLSISGIGDVAIKEIEKYRWDGKI